MPGWQMRGVARWYWSGGKDGVVKVLLSAPPDDPTVERQAWATAVPAAGRCR